MTLLPPNATALERALEGATARLSAIDTGDVARLWDPATCPLGVLPWLAWSLSVDSWDPDWSEARKREAVAESIALHRHKGTRLSVEAVLARFDAPFELVEWWQQTPRAAPHTFELRLPLDAASGARATAAFAEDVVRAVGRVKPLREHFRFVQQVALAGSVGVQVAVRPLTFAREDMALTVDTSRPWTALLQDENGEPLQDDAAAYLDETA